MQGIKRKRRCQNQCDQHLFSLKNLKSNAKYDIKLSFCPKYQRQPLPPEHTFAEFNNDGLFYTSAFVLGVDKKLVAKNLQKQMLDHQKLIKENCEKYNQVVFPRPNSKHTTCSVCKETYKNYYIHIFSDQHSQKIQESSYNVCIKQLCQLFKENWEGCAQKADQQALYQMENGKQQFSKKVSQELNLDDILEQEEINQNPSRMEYEEQAEPESEVKEVVMKKVQRGSANVQPVKSRLYEDRQSRKRHVSYAAFFDDSPHKKSINQRRQAITIPHKKFQKLSSIKQSKHKQQKYQKQQLDQIKHIKDKKQKVQIKQIKKQLLQIKKKKEIFQNDDPFIIEHNARIKPKQRKSYYYIKKKEREERELREKQLLLKGDSGYGNNKNTNKQLLSSSEPIQGENQVEGRYDEEGNCFFLKDQEYEQEEVEEEGEDQLQQSSLQQNNQKKSEEDYEKYFDKFHQDETIKTKQAYKPEKEIKKTLSTDLYFFQEVQKKPLLNSILQPIIKSIIPNDRYTPNTQILNSVPISHPQIQDKPFESAIMKKNPPLQSFNSQKAELHEKQQILDKNKIHYTPNELPLFHKFKNQYQKTNLQENKVKLQKNTMEVFNQYEQKIRSYQKQKQYNQIYRQRKFKQPISNDESTVRINKSQLFKQFQEPYKHLVKDSQFIPYDEETQKPVKIQAFHGSNKVAPFSQAYYKKSIADKEVKELNPIQTQVPINSMNPPPNLYPNTNQYYPPSYGYPIASYGYPIHQSQKIDRSSLKYGEQRQTQSYERGYYYPGWNSPYYMPGSIPVQSGSENQSGKNHSSNNYGSKEDKKAIVYPPYSSYPYPNSTFQGYYPPPGNPYQPTQRSEYVPHPHSNLRMTPPPPQPPNTSININFPMYVGPPYHGQYGYQHTPQSTQPGSQRYPQSGLNSQNSQNQYIPSKGHPQQSMYGSYGVNGANNSLPPYAEYQEFKKRENERRR